MSKFLNAHRFQGFQGKCDPVSAAVGIGGALISKRASDKQVSAARDAQDAQYQQYLQQREDMQPWMKRGEKSLDEYYRRRHQLPERPNLLGFQFDPSQLGQTDAYKFRLQQGFDAIDNAKGLSLELNSGSRANDLMTYGQDMASQEFENEYARQFGSNQAENLRRMQDFQNRFNLKETQMNRLASLANLGQTTANQIGSAGQQFAANAGNAMMSAGQSQAAGLMGMGNSLMGIGDAYMYNQGYNQQPQSYSPPPPVSVNTTPVAGTIGMNNYQWNNPF